jgi:hypothetical protein
VDTIHELCGHVSTSSFFPKLSLLHVLTVGSGLVALSNFSLKLPRRYSPPPQLLQVTSILPLKIQTLKIQILPLPPPFILRLSLLLPLMLLLLLLPLLLSLSLTWLLILHSHLYYHCCCCSCHYCCCYYYCCSCYFPRCCCCSPENLATLAEYCSEFLVHGVDVEGKKCGIEEPLVVLLGQSCPLPVTYGKRGIVLASRM